ncbi:hypothetical protein BGZ57DRAFT_363915 [Hyaloscypha finlandica]|nr:hypothetical protein BGZ57DRAFT_363915 [Hyaloscypha finlandica]
MVHSDLEGTHEIVGRESERMSLTRVVDLNGHQVAEKLDYNENFFIQSEPFKMSKPGKEEYAGYNKQGNGFTTHVYRQTALVFTPKNYRHAFLLGQASDYFRGKISLTETGGNSSGCLSPPQSEAWRFGARSSFSPYPSQCKNQT